MKNLQVKKSKIHGLGVFVTKPVKKGERISFIRGRVCRQQIRNTKAALSHACWIGIGNEKWIDPEYPFKYMNHSCNPSVSIKGKITVIALKDLQPGDEVSIDYSVTEGNPLWFMKCDCGATNCRKVIKSVEFLSEKTLQHYLPFVPTYFKKLWRKRNTATLFL